MVPPCHPLLDLGLSFRQEVGRVDEAEHRLIRLRGHARDREHDHHPEKGA